MNIKRNSLNILLLFVFVALAIYSLVTFFAFGSNYQTINSILILLAVNIVFNIAIGLMFNKKKSRLLHNLGLNNISLKQISGFEKVKTIIFSKQGLISRGKYKLLNVEPRFTVSKKSVIETASQLAKLWESQYEKAILKKQKVKPEDKNLSIVRKSKEGIMVADEKKKKTMLGFYSFVRDFVIKDDGSTLYLIKNNFLAGKFTFKEKLNKKVIDLVKKLNQFGNLVYLDSQPEDKNSEILPFDKGYTNLNIDEQKSIISNLTDKAKTALFTSDKKLTGLASFDFLISESGGNQLNKSSIYINFDELYFIPKLMYSLKKVHTQFEYTLSFILILNIAFVFYLVFV